MNRKVVITPAFKRAYKKFVRHNPARALSLDLTLSAMAEDLSATFLECHKLRGKLYGLMACSCGYDCRIVFSIETDRITNEEVLLLHDIGTHDEVY